MYWYTDLKQEHVANIIGKVHFGGTDWRYLIELDEWDIKSGATHRWANMNQMPYVRTETPEGIKWRDNPTFRTGLLKLRPRAKKRFDWMNSQYDWITDDPFVAVKIEMYEEPWTLQSLAS